MEKKDESLVFGTKVSADNWVKSYLLLWSSGLKLTDSEFELVLELVKEYFNLKNTIITESQRFEVLFSTRTRSKVRDKLGISTSLFNNRISSLKAKGIIKNVNGNLVLDKKIIPVKEITFKFYVDEQ